MKERDIRIDALKFIGIVCIILAHTTPPDLIFELRNFDVVLMVMLTGTTYCLSDNKNFSYNRYLFKRFRRLIVPTWLFLSIFFSVFKLISLITNTPYFFDTRKIIRSYFLMDGIGYVWIMRIYFFCALMCPLLLWISKKVKHNLHFFLGLIPVYLLYIALIEMNNGINHVFLSDFFQAFVVDAIGWGLIVAVGIRLINLSTKERILYTVTLFVIHMCLRITHQFASIQNFKYPPQMYYISYGLFVSFLLYLLFDSNIIKKLFTNKCCMYIARNSLWVYFWHIIPIYLINHFGNMMPSITRNFITRFIVIIMTALILTVIQNYLFNRKKKVLNPLPSERI